MYRSEYPRPQLQRKDWLCLNGQWQFAFDPQEVSQKEHWETVGHSLPLEIQVPFCCESPLSGIDSQAPHKVLFYKRSFVVPTDWAARRILLHFEAVDYFCRVYINGTLAGSHTGGNVGFHFDITELLHASGEQELSVYVEDPFDDESIPRGKQYWKEKSESIWYTRTSGIWQSVWLEPVAPVHLSHLKVTPDIDRGEVVLEAEFSSFVPGLTLGVEISFQGEVLCNDQCSVTSKTVFRRAFDLAGDHVFNGISHGARRFWSPENPSLFDLKLTLQCNGSPIDRIDSYFGMRKIHTENGMIYLNNQPYYMKLVLDQGYWPQGLLTAPSDSAFQEDIRLMKEMGFNGCRKHQKVEDARFLYWADQMGFLVWGEMASACIYTDRTAIAYQQEWQEILRRDYNHPSIVAWVPFNESWCVAEIKHSVRQQAYTRSLYHMLKALDQTRLVVNNDGWELTETDLCAIHNYAHGAATEASRRAVFQATLNSMERLLSPVAAGKNIFADGFSYQGQPILLTECGGISYDKSHPDSWGYTTAGNEEQFLEQYRFVIESILSSDLLYGFCYTQLSDVEQETNGLLTYDRKPKCDPAKIREINETYRHICVYYETDSAR